MSTTIATFQISQLFNTIARNLSGAKNVAFTMAEILLSLTIIGVVAAITLPSLTGNINERTWNTQRKALYARFSQALALMPSLNGYGIYTKDEYNDITIADTAAETFLTDGLSKVLKINNICDHEHLEDCGIPRNITTLNGDVLSNFTGSYNTLGNFYGKFGNIIDFEYSTNTNTKAAAFETQNGESIIVYYNPNCIDDLGEVSGYRPEFYMCANFVYDLNGNKGPNTVGKDIGFITAFYPADSAVVAPIPLKTNAGDSIEQPNAGAACKAQDSESRVPNRNELAAMLTNRRLLGIFSGDYWSSKIFPWSGDFLGIGISFLNGDELYSTRDAGYAVRCIKR